MLKKFSRSHPANACGHFSKGNACDRRRWRKKGARVGAAVGDRRGGVSADDGAGHRKRKPRFCFPKDQEGRRGSPVGCCVAGNPIQGFPDAASRRICAAGCRQARFSTRCKLLFKQLFLRCRLFLVSPVFTRRVKQSVDHPFQNNGQTLLYTFLIHFGNIFVDGG